MNNRMLLLFKKKSKPYLLRDNFTTDDDSPITTPRICEPGPGTLVSVVNDGTLSISGGKLNFTAQTTPVYGDQRIYDPIIRARANSSSFRVNLNIGTLANGKEFTLGWNSAVTGGYLTHSLYPRSTSKVLNIYNGASSRNVGAYTDNIEYIYTSVLRPTVGAYHVIQGGTQYVNPTLIWVDFVTSTASLYSGMSNYDAVGSLKNWQVFNSVGNWASDYGVAVSRNATPADGSELNGVSDGMVDFTWIPLAGEVLNLMVRRTDDNNCWIVRCDQAGSTVRLYEKVAGVETQRGTAANTFTPSTTYHIRAIFYSNTIVGYVSTTADGGVLKWSYTSASFQNTETNAKISGFTGGSNFVYWPRTVTMPGVSSAMSDTFFSVGDSKTFANQYQIYLAANLSLASGYKTIWTENPVTLSYNNETAALMAARIDAELATRGGSPSNILLNLGVNDSISLPLEATWKTDYTYILDALHAKYPSAKIYCMKPGRRGEFADCTTISAWLLDVIATRSSFAFSPAFLDEKIFLENGDDYVTYTSDGIHPNTPGYQLTAAKWQTAMGY